MELLEQQQLSEVRQAALAAGLGDARADEVLVLDGLNLEEIGRTDDVHRSTVSRWLAPARQALFTETRGLLAARLRLSHRELESLMRLFSPNVDISIGRFF